MVARPRRGARACAASARWSGASWTAPARPIVLLEARRAGRARAGAVGRDRRTGASGVFLPYTPLHHLLLEARRAAARADLAATSPTSRSPPTTRTPLERLAGLADGFLAHDREIRARYDDSVTRVVAAARESIVRRGRGYAPEPLPLPGRGPPARCSPSARSSSTRSRSPAAARAHVAPHNGDLEDLRDAPRLHGRPRAPLAAARARAGGGRPRPPPGVPVHASTPWRGSRPRGGSPSSTTTRTSPRAPRSTGSPGPFLGVAYDGLGMGDDGTFWGGELLARGPARLPAAGAVRPGPDARRRARGAASRTGWRWATSSAPRDRRRRGRRRAARGADSARARGRRSSPASTRARSRVVRTQVARGLNAPVASSRRPPVRRRGRAAGPPRRRRVRGAGGDRPGARRRRPPRGRRCPGASTASTASLVYDPRPTLAALLEGVLARRARRPARGAASSATIAEVTRELLARRARPDRRPHRVPLGRRVPEPAARLGPAPRRSRRTASRCSSTGRSPSTTAGSAMVRRPSPRPGWLGIGTTAGAAPAQEG